MKRSLSLMPLAGLLLYFVLAVIGCSPAEPPQPPVAKVMPHEFKEHGNVRVDNYYWLRERDNPEVVSYLEAENAYTEAIMKPTKKLQKELFEEIKGRIKQNDESVPYLENGYWYYQRFEEGKQYPIYCRKQGTREAPEQIMLDQNELAEGQSYCATRGREVSSGNDLLAYGVDFMGRRFYTLHIRNLETGQEYPDVIPDCTGNLAWAEDDRTLFYSKQDPETLRPYLIYRHELGTDPAADVVVYEEPDETFRCGVFKTKSRQYIMIGCYQTLSNEYRYLAANDPNGAFRILQPREREHEYSVDHYGDSFYIRTNWRAKNFRLMKTPVSATTKENWREVIPHRDDVLLEGEELFADFLVLSERKDGLIRLRIIPWDGSAEHYLDFGEPAYMAWISTNPEFDTSLLRYGYSSLTTPNSIYDYDMQTHAKTLMKQDEVLGGYEPANYEVERIYAMAEDGVKVPISLVYRHGFVKDGSRPFLLYAYGSYGYSTDADFTSSVISLLDRGFGYGIAHVRGGEEMGRWWYDDGKLLHKKNTFTDFITCAEYLVSQGYTSKDKLFAEGGSAGGLLMGAIANMAPADFKGIIAEVPYVDVVTTMFDASIPLTTDEYDEWGNPADKTYYDYMLSYSPYDNVKAQAYPNILITTSLHDSQVQYWEPAKWTAKLRALKTDQNRLLLKTNMEAGHGGASGRYERYRETAFNFAFMLDLLGIKN
jgi:oligopeptidase B